MPKFILFRSLVISYVSLLLLFAGSVFYLYIVTNNPVIYHKVSGTDYIRFELDQYTPIYKTRAHNLIEAEHEAGLSTDDEMANAYFVLDRFLDYFKDEKPYDSPKYARALFGRIAQEIDQHFIYLIHTPFTQGLNDGLLDCDLLSYLYLGVADSIEFNRVSLMLSPGHAFPVWRGVENDFQIAWEATAKGGNVIDIGASNYKESTDPKNYQFFSDTDIKYQQLANVAYRLYADHQEQASIDIYKKIALEWENPLYEVLFAYAAKDLDRLTVLVKKYHDMPLDDYIGNIHYENGDLTLAAKYYKKMLPKGASDYDALFRIIEVEHDLWLEIQAHVMRFNITKLRNYFILRTDTIESFIIMILVFFIVGGPLLVITIHCLKIILFWLIYSGKSVLLTIHP